MGRILIDSRNIEEKEVGVGLLVSGETLVEVENVSSLVAGDILGSVIADMCGKVKSKEKFLVALLKHIEKEIDD